MPTEAWRAPAKINLALHITGQRADGYHLLDSLVAFAGVGDEIRVALAESLSLQVSGPFAAGVPVDESNLVLRAARLLAPGRGARIHLHKVLPVASGIGGGSADAACTLRALAALWHCPLPKPAAALRLGADVPACLSGGALRMTGIGEGLAPLPALPPAHLVLVNPGIGLATPEVFRALERRENPPLPATLPRFADAGDLAGWLALQRNDLEGPAMRLQPVIGTVLEALRGAEGCLLARMSGSGATCFGLFAGEALAARAAARLGAVPGWWVAAAPLLS